jgi:two-component sensor histidine kinase
MSAITTIWQKYRSRVIRNFIHDSDVPEGLDYWRKKLFAGIMVYLPPLGVLIILPSLIVVLNSGNPGMAVSYISAVFIVTFLALYPSFSLFVRKVLFLCLLYFVAIILLFYLGVMGSSLTYFYGITIFALLIASNKAGMYTVLINAVIFSFYGFLIYTGEVEYTLRDTYQVTSWLTISSNSLVLSIVSVVLLPMLFDGLQDTIARYRQSQDELSKSLLELKKKNDEVRLAQTRYNTICKITNEVIWEWDIENDIHIWSGENDHLVKSAEEQTDISLDSWFSKIHPDDLNRVRTSFLSVVRSDDINEWQEEYRFLKMDGMYAWVLDRGFVIRDLQNKPVRFVGGMLDISPMKNNEMIIRESLEEKETLLAEIHHRVKNNLAAVTGMLQLQVFQEENEELTEKLIDSMMRIKSIANIHEQLYQSKSFSRIDLGKSLEQLISTVIDTMQTGTDIELRFETDTVEISVNEAIPCSLVVNEVITNIVKHAFPGKNEGVISVNLISTGATSCRLEIIDNGVGLPKGFPGKADKKLGMELITTLTRQLEAEFGYSDNQGTTIFYMEFEAGIKESLNGVGYG